MGKKLSLNERYNIMATHAVLGNLRETARRLGLAESTVRKIVGECVDDERYAQMCAIARKKFELQSSDIVNKGTELLLRRLDRALEDEDTLDKLIEEVSRNSELGGSQASKRALINKIKDLEMQSVGDITRAVNMAHEKRALELGEATANETLRVEFMQPSLFPDAQGGEAGRKSGAGSEGQTDASWSE